MTRRKIDVRPYSKLVLDGVKQTASRAMLRAVSASRRIGSETNRCRRQEITTARPTETTRTPPKIPA